MLVRTAFAWGPVLGTDPGSPGSLRGLEAHRAGGAESLQQYNATSTRPVVKVQLPRRDRLEK